MLGERPYSTKGLAVCAHRAQRVRADGFTLIVKVSGNKNRVKTETSLTLNFGGDGPFADTSPNQDLMTVPQDSNGLEGRRAEILDAHWVVIDKVRKQSQDALVANRREDVGGINAGKTIERIHEEPCILNHHHRTVVRKMMHGLLKFGSCDLLQIIRLGLNDAPLGHLQRLHIHAQRLEMVRCLFQLASVGGKKPYGAAHEGGYNRQPKTMPQSCFSLPPSKEVL